MSSLRKLERNVIRSKCYSQTGTTSKFTEEWKNYRSTKYGENIPMNTMQKKKRFLDKKDNFIAGLRYQKAKIAEYFENLKKEQDTSASEQ